MCTKLHKLATVKKKHSQSKTSPRLVRMSASHPHTVYIRLSGLSRPGGGSVTRSSSNTPANQNPGTAANHFLSLDVNTGRTQRQLGVLPNSVPSAALKLPFFPPFTPQTCNPSFNKTSTLTGICFFNNRFQR